MNKGEHQRLSRGQEIGESAGTAAECRKDELRRTLAERNADVGSQRPRPVGQLNTGRAQRYLKTLDSEQKPPVLAQQVDCKACS